MKHRTQHDLIDPEVPRSALEFDFEGDNDAEPANDAYVIGENGDVVFEGGAQPEEAAHERTRPWAKPAAFVLGALFVVLTFWNIGRFAQGPPPPPKPTPFKAKQALYLGVMKLDAYQRVHGTVPQTLAEAGLPEAGVYVYQYLGPTRYMLSFRAGGSKLEYDSNESKESFFGPAKELLTMGDSK